MSDEPKDGPTPGEWSADHDDRDFVFPWKIHTEAGVGGEIASVCYIPRPEDEIRPGEIEANARIMAASKDLIRELERVEWSLDGEHCPTCEGEKDQGHQPDCTLGTVLRKARGKDR